MEVLEGRVVGPAGAPVGFCMIKGVVLYQLADVPARSRGIRRCSRVRWPTRSDDWLTSASPRRGWTAQSGTELAALVY